MKRSLMLLALALAACDHPTPPPQPQTADTPSPLFKTQIQALDKAKAVEGQVEDAADAQRKQVDEATK